jgi:hypothetical protein
MPDTVYIIGAGASYGESLVQLLNLPAGHPEPHHHQPPLTNGFFAAELLDAIAYDQAEQDFPGIIEYIRRTRLVEDRFGEGKWQTINLEEVFTGLEVEREFQNPESDLGAHLLLVRNKLVRYIRRIIGFCTQGTFGRYYRVLTEAIQPNDSVITFNWDLLLDQEFLEPLTGVLINQYSKFFRTVQAPEGINCRFGPGDGLYLKLHGSLNWFRCGNGRCQSSKEITFVSQTQSCLSLAEGIGEFFCYKCGSEMNPIIVPPLLRKPIVEDAAIRSAWGLARMKLESASRVVAIGFSAAPTDFYTSWLLRSSVGTREDVEIIVINPNNRENNPDREEFRKRMNSIFLRGYNSEFHEFSQIGSVLGNPDGQAAAN